MGSSRLSPEGWVRVPVYVDSVTQGTNYALPRLKDWTWGLWVTRIDTRRPFSKTVHLPYLQCHDTGGSFRQGLDSG